MAAVAIVHPETKEIRVTSRLFLYGNHASVEVGQAIANEIMTLYNAPQVEILIGESSFQVVFEIHYVVVEKVRDLIFLAQNNRDYRNNFVRIEESNLAERSFMGFSIGENAGHWLITDDLGHSTTAAHEFGHSLGLDHPENLDFRGRGVPPIMAPRGSFVDAQYQWNPTVEAGEYGGTLRPVYRKVATEEVRSLFENKNLEEKSNWQFGHITNTLFDSFGNRLVVS